MSVILGIDPGLTNTAVVSLRAEEGRPLFLLDRLLICNGYQGDRGKVDRIAETWYRVREFAFVQEPDLIAIEKFTWVAHDEDRNGEKARCPRCNHFIPLPRGEKGISGEAQEMYRLIGALGTLREIAPIEEITPAQWRIHLTGHPMPKRKLAGGILTRTGYEHQVRKVVYDRLGLNGGDNLSLHEVDAAGVAICAAERFLGISNIYAEAMLAK